MTRPASLLRAATACLAGLVLLAGCSGEPSGTPSPSPSTSPDSTATTASPSTSPSTLPSAEPVARPEVGDCFRMDFDEAVAPTSEQDPSSCTEQHASQTYFVGRLRLVVDGHLLAVASDAVQRQPAEACPRRLAAWLGGTPAQLRLSMLRPVWFTPTLEESDAGAAWFRCDVVALADEETLLPMKRPARGLLQDPDRRALFGVCGTDRPDGPDFSRVACAREHTWRAVSSYDVSGTRYVQADVQLEGSVTCKDLVGAQAEDPLNFEWGYDYPSEEQWDAGQHYGLCWAPA